MTIMTRMRIMTIMRIIIIIIIINNNNHSVEASVFVSIGNLLGPQLIGLLGTLC